MRKKKSIVKILPDKTRFYLVDNAGMIWAFEEERADLIVANLQITAEKGVLYKTEPLRGNKVYHDAPNLLKLLDTVHINRKSPILALWKDEEAFPK